MHRLQTHPISPTSHGPIYRSRGLACSCAFPMFLHNSAVPLSVTRLLLDKSRRPDPFAVRGRYVQMACPTSTRYVLHAPRPFRTNIVLLCMSRSKNAASLQLYINETNALVARLRVRRPHAGPPLKERIRNAPSPRYRSPSPCRPVTFWPILSAIAHLSQVSQSCRSTSDIVIRAVCTANEDVELW